jgi:hypothetical protein
MNILQVQTEINLLLIMVATQEQPREAQSADNDIILTETPCMLQHVRLEVPCKTELRLNHNITAPRQTGVEACKDQVEEEAQVEVCTPMEGAKSLL